MSDKPCDDLSGTCDQYPACVCGRAWKAHEAKLRKSTLNAENGPTFMGGTSIAQPAMTNTTSQGREAINQAMLDFLGDTPTQDDEDFAIAIWQAALKHAVPEGYCVVPVEPTDEDFKRGVRAFQSGFNGTDNLSDWRAFWQAMIAAGRKP